MMAVMMSIMMMLVLLTIGNIPNWLCQILL